MVAFVCVFICHTIAIKIPRSSGHFADYRKKNTCQNFLTQKIPKSWISNPKKSSATPHHMKYGVPTWGYYSLVGHDLSPKKQVTLYVFQKKMAIYCIWNEKKILMPLHCHYLWQCFLQNALIIFLEKLSWPEYIIIFYRGFQTLWLG